MAFAFPLQLLASIFGFLARDSAAATGMGILSASWLTIGLVKLNSAPTATSAALLIPAIGTAFGKLALALVLFLAATRFFFTGIYQLTANPDVQYAAGVVGLVLLGVAFYAALALELEDVRRKTVLPLLRLGAGKASVEGNMDDQLEREAGVREEL